MYRLVAISISAFIVSFSITFSQTSKINLKNDLREDPVINVNVDGTDGWLRGKELTTVGKAQRPFFTFRNIPFAQEPERFMPPHMRNLDDVLKGTAVDEPYDATRAGPMCEQSNRSPGSVDNLNHININDVVENLLEGAELPLPPALNNAEAILTILEQVVGIDLYNKSMGEIIDDWMDMQLSASPDCLQLSVSMPTLPQENGKLLPVMFWIYGGAFYSGSNNLYGPERLGDVADVILVAINYRVGPLGFMCLDSENAMGNMGMLDQVMALRWVRKYIHLFGGDKDQVTVFGESAGSASITHLLLSNLTDGMFHRAIGQSGSALAGWAFDKEPEYHARRIARKVDCDKADQEDLIQCLKDIPAVNLTMAHSEYVKEERARGTMGFGGTVPCAQTKGLEHETFYFEGQHPADLLRSGNYDHMPILMGANSHEGSFVYGSMPYEINIVGRPTVYNQFIIPNNISDQPHFLKYEFTDFLLRAVGIDQEYAFSDCLQEKYWHEEQIGNLTAMTAGAVDMLGVFFIKASAYKMIEENSKHGKDSYFYSLEHKSKKSVCHAMMLKGLKPHDDFAPGVCHADDLMYIFNLDVPLVLCNIEELMPTLTNTLIRCIFTAGLDPVKLGKCVAEPDSEFMEKYGECILGQLTEQEMEWSESILKTWTNFAIHGSPSPDTFPADGPPDQFIEPWTHDNPVYLRFAADGVSVAKDYKLTYNIALDEEDEQNGKK